MFTRVQRLFAIALLSLAAAAAGAADDRRLSLAVPEALAETGFLQYRLPRFSLKNAVPVTLVAPGEAADARLGEAEGTPIFEGGGQVWRLAVAPEAAETPQMRKLLDWLESDVGARTIESFAGPPAYTVAARQQAAGDAIALDGDLARGAELSLLHCGRCHVVGPQNRMAGLGSTPSFAALRTFGNWRDRFEAFYALNPHPAFSQLDGITPPFPEGQAPTTAPVLLTQEELDDIVAFAASVAPADLGAPIQHQ